jgi:hypothetical protein
MLEPRHLLAADLMAAISSAVGVQAVAVQTPSARGSKVLPSSLESVARGSTYYVEVWIQDRLEPGVGLSGGTVDVDYSQSVSQAVKVVNLDFQLFPDGTIDSADGVVRSLGGGMLQAGLGVAPNWVRLGYVEILATSSGQALFELGAGASQFSRYGQGNVAWSQVDLGSPIVVEHLGSHWQNPIHPCDVNHDDTITPLDALVAINEINLNGIRELPVPGAGTPGPPPYYDVTGDDWLTAQDVLLVVNYLNQNGPGPVPAGASSASPTAASGLGGGSWAEGEALPDSLSAVNSWQFGNALPERYQTDLDASSQLEASDTERWAVATDRSRPVHVPPSSTLPAVRPQRFEPWELSEDLLTLLAVRITDRPQRTSYLIYTACG